MASMFLSSLTKLFDIFLHIDEYLDLIIQQFGIWTYVILFGVIFVETGLVIMPFLPGDSLLFAAGAFAATGSLHIFWLWILLVIAAFLGDTVNYWIGHFIGPIAFERDNRFLKKEYLKKAQDFYDKHGGFAIVLARFVPIVRTFAPFVAGIGKMSYFHFLMYNLIGGVVWVTGFLFAGYFMGNIPFIQENFHYAVVIIVAVSILPMIFEWWKAKQEKAQAALESTK